jgi:hypothetical protein
MYRTVMVDGAMPHSARVLVERVSDLFLMDVHAMLRLPRADVGITQACNFTIQCDLRKHAVFWPVAMDKSAYAIMATIVVCIEPAPCGKDRA